MLIVHYKSQAHNSCSAQLVEKGASMKREILVRCAFNVIVIVLEE